MGVSDVLLLPDNLLPSKDQAPFTVGCFVHMWFGRIQCGKQFVVKIKELQFVLIKQFLLINNPVFKNVAPCRLVSGCQRFRVF